MFISFGLYIILIILAIIMTVLIVYLTMTSSKGLPSTNTYDPEEEARLRLAQNKEADTSHLFSNNEQKEYRAAYDSNHQTHNRANDFDQPK